MISTLHRDLGLTDDELEAIVAILDRDPTYTELAMFSVMWSEHCSYKSSRIHLRNLPAEGPHVVVGPGEGAGVVEVADGISVAWKIESHNHPSFVEPVNGAATGVGGIVRDVLSMGARPIALVDSLRFGSVDDARTRYLVHGVVSGISSYGNSIGVPTVGGETVFDESYSGNPLVNVACLGVIEHRVMHGRADGPGNALLMYGASTGRDGIGGASVLASTEFDQESMTKRPSVQVGDPFTEKLLIEATLEMMRRGLLVGLQDLGAGGLSCPTSEMSAKASTGAHVELDRVARREPGMDPFEVMISESQERMLAVVAPERIADTISICERWGIDARIVGEVTDTGRVEVVSEGDVIADAPARALSDLAPAYDRPVAKPAWQAELQQALPGDSPPSDVGTAFRTLLACPNVASKRWIWEQYDHMIFLGTIIGPGGDAAVIRLPDSEVAVAVTTDGPGRFCYLDPYRGAVLAVSEAARNVACTGAKPLAVTNCLNFGNPEREEIMWQFTEVIRGIADACRALGTPVTGGNVSFYNETAGRSIYPTPVIGMMGVLDPADSAVGLAFDSSGDRLLLLGETDGSDFAGSEYAAIVNGTVGGLPPLVDLGAEAALHTFLSEARTRGLVRSAHDVSTGGLAVCLAEAAIASSIGFELECETDYRFLFAESPSRAVVSCRSDDEADLVGLARDTGVRAQVIGSVGGREIDFANFSVGVEDARKAFEGGLASRLSATMS